MKQHTKFQQQEQESAAIHEQQTQAQNSREFATVEDMLRTDAAQTPVPPAVAERLNKSVAQLPPPRLWWQRWFGG